MNFEISQDGGSGRDYYLLLQVFKSCSLDVGWIIFVLL